MTEVVLKTMEHSSRQYATCADFSRIFVEDMKNLYLLALVLTADSVKAEQCFVSGLDDCITGNQVFTQWARSWARRVVIKNAIRMIAPGRSKPGFATSHHESRAVSNGARTRRVPVEVSAIFELPAIERFAFVMSVLERYSDLDSALLLGCTRESFIQARLQALERISRLQGGTTSKTRPLREDRSSIEELDLRVHLATPA